MCLRWSTRLCSSNWSVRRAPPASLTHARAHLLVCFRTCCCSAITAACCRCRDERPTAPKQRSLEARRECVLGRSAPRRQLASRCCNDQRPARRAVPACMRCPRTAPACKQRAHAYHHITRRAHTRALIAGARHGRRERREHPRARTAAGNLALSSSRGPACSKHSPSAQPHTRHALSSH